MAVYASLDQYAIAGVFKLPHRYCWEYWNLLVILELLLLLLIMICSTVYVFTIPWYLSQLCAGTSVGPVFMSL